MDPIVTGGIVAFVVTAIVLAIAWGSSTLSKLPPLAGERQLFELAGVTVSQRSLGAPTNFIRCVVRVTNRRIIVAQAALLTKDPLLRFVITHSAEGAADAGLGATLRRGYVACDLAPGAIEVSTVGGRTTLVIALRGGAIAGEQSLHIPVDDLAPWRAAGLLGS